MLSNHYNMYEKGVARLVQGLTCMLGGSDATHSGLRPPEQINMDLFQPLWYL